MGTNYLQVVHQVFAARGGCNTPYNIVAVWIENVVVRANESALLGSVSYIPIARPVTIPMNNAHGRESREAEGRGAGWRTWDSLIEITLDGCVSVVRENSPIMRTRKPHCEIMPSVLSDQL